MTWDSRGKFYDQGRADERVAIVAWLRDAKWLLFPESWREPLAGRIERGDHIAALHVGSGDK